jgi:glycogen phosphorylase
MGVMSDHVPVGKPTYSLFPADIDGFGSLAGLALDMRWSWNHATDEVWRRLDPDLWEFTQNTWVVLQTVSRDKLQQFLAEPAFRKMVNDLVRDTCHEAELSSWFDQTHPHSALITVANFCKEFMLSEALPIYSGGLRNVAGDQLKAVNFSVHCGIRDSVTIPLEELRILWQR